MDDVLYKIIGYNYTLSCDEKLSKCCINGKQQDLTNFKTESLVKVATVKDLLSFHETQYYNEFFRKFFKNIVVLAGAGTSVNNGSQKGKTREELWKECNSEVTKILSLCKSDIKLKNIAEDENLESFLSRLAILENAQDKEYAEKKLIEEKIRNNCSLRLDENAPHLHFLNKITARKSSDPRVKIFTTNYDTLFEQAANRGAFVVIDGFSFTQPRTFSGRYFDLDIVNREKTRLKHEDNFITKVFHLYKLHGSLIWEKKDSVIMQNDSTSDPLIVYPANNKFESSFEQPYFEMMSRFQNILRQENLMLIVVGFGFQDKHIQNIILEAVDQNSSFHLVIIDYNKENRIDCKKYKDNLGLIKEDEDFGYRPKRNVTILFNDFEGLTKLYPDNKTYASDSYEHI